MRKKLALLFVTLMLALGVVGTTAAVNPTPAAAVPGPFGSNQVFKVAPFSRSIKVSNGAQGFGLRKTLKPGTTAKIYVWSVYIPPHCVLQWTQNRINFTKRNDRNKGKWVTGAFVPYGKMHARIICRG